MSAVLQPIPNDDPQSLIGERILLLRTRRQITLDRLAQLTGFSKGYLSKIENAKKVPPIGSLSRIAQALEVELAYFFQRYSADAFDGVSAVTAGQSEPVVRGGSNFGYDYQVLPHHVPGKHMEPFIFTFPSALDKHVYFEHEGEEFLFVLSGVVEFETGARGQWKKWELNPGDDLYFDARVPHKGRRISGEAKALVVVYSAEKK